MRLCANTGCRLHLIHPLGFELDDKRMRRAGLDYMDRSVIHEYPDYASCRQRFASERVFACSTKGSTFYTQPQYTQHDAFLFGPETRGLPQQVLDEFDAEHILRIPMLPQSRSLNLSNTAAIFLYEAWRQQQFVGAD